MNSPMIGTRIMGVKLTSTRSDAIDYEGGGLNYVSISETMPDTRYRLFQITRRLQMDYPYPPIRRWLFPPYRQANQASSVLRVRTDIAPGFPGPELSPTCRPTRLGYVPPSEVVAGIRPPADREAPTSEPVSSLRLRNLNRLIHEFLRRPLPTANPVTTNAVIRCTI